MDEQVQLDLPGAGVPWWQMLAGKHFFLPYYTARFGWDGSRKILLDEGAKLLARGAKEADEKNLTRRVLVSPQIGLEDSSRYWSYSMVLEHLVILGRIATDIIIELSQGRVPRSSVGTADLKPEGMQPVAEARQEFRSFLDQFDSRMTEEVADKHSPTRCVHPWFGPLTARQWICFLPFHQRIHFKQARAILKIANVLDS